MAAATDWVMRFVRLYRPDLNPLRRRSDRWEALVVALATALVLLSIWPIALMGSVVYQNGLRAELAGRQARESVVATLVRTPAGTQQWQGEHGQPITGQVTPLTQVRVGSSYRVWVDAHNQVTPRPRSHTETILSTAVAVFSLGLTAIIAVSLVYRSARFFLDRHRYAQWSAAWAIAEERWRRPRQP